MQKTNKQNAIIQLEDGTKFKGKVVSLNKPVFGEICFNTGMTGYQEIFTDPSYYGQIMVTTNAHIGNYGANDKDLESDKVQINALVCKNFSHEFSREDVTESLFSFLEKNDLTVISDVDTRALVQYIRDKGAMNAVVTLEDDVEKVSQKLNDLPSMVGLDLASKVSTKEAYFQGNPNATYKIAVLDIGIKQNIINNLTSRDCYVKVFPYNATFKELKAFNPDGYFLSNGPGDPEPLKDAQNVAKEIIKKDLPLFGICLGHQVIALANNISTYKMHNGHRGINHPVKNLISGKGEITSQNHGFVVKKEDVDNNQEFEITHLHLNDSTVAGMRMKNKNCFSVQYHPEASPGPHDSSYLFDQFIQNINKNKN